ncbi:putative V-type proton ATPase subunit F [Blattamonas nauphoetae]|uniref:V-type proton ATPase subunit F n=1 Tax=Blattamonas nauphoetae TaxID=2049346 RepID=A0ABQ9Y4X5_9EUKA|nr:putative V-type proton ATPase subunit F [Blattamonas nauphoetae]
MSRIREGNLIFAVIGEEDLIMGLLMGGIGNLDAQRNPNYFVCDSKTSKEAIQTAFRTFVSRPDIGILVITQAIAEVIRDEIEDFDAPLPAILEVPGKTTGYDSAKDAILRRAQRLTSSRMDR